MSTIVRVQHKGQVTIPTHLRTQAGIAEGDLIEATFHRGKIVLTPKLVDEYTPAQRRKIDAGLAKANADVKAGRLSPVFTDHAELISHLHNSARKRDLQKNPKRPVR